MKLKITAGTTNKITRIQLKDSSSTVGGNLSGVLFNAAGLTAYYSRIGDAGSTQINLVTATVGTYTSGGFIAIDDTNMTGVYELHLPNAVLAAGSTAANVVLQGAANMVPKGIEIELDAINYQVSVPDSVWGANPSGYNNTVSFGSGIYKQIQDIYYADIKPVNANQTPNNEYGVFWFRNASPLGSGAVTNPAISVFNCITGTSLFQNKRLGYVAVDMGALSYVESTNMMVSGVPYEVKVSGIIDGVNQNWRHIVGLDYM